ncbi:hypothetical protein FRC03_007268 [Tulasnella sp. 419]|nr:hypothetical protein FRC03_007268 [Tulasnella sp. 419]
MRSTSIFATAGFLAAQLANAQSLAPLWYQCGGIYYKGPIECEPPGICVYIDPTYSQCQPKDYFYSTSRVGTVKPTGTAVTITKTETVTVTSTLPCTTISTRCISSTPVPTSSTRPPVSSPYSSTKPTVTSWSTDKPTSSTRPTVITSSTKPPVTST